MLDYARFFIRSQPSEFEVIEIGNLHLPTGRVFCCDPFLNFEVSALNCAVAPGDYPVRLCIAKLPDWGKRVALAGTFFSRDIPHQWVKANYELNGDRFSAFRVDSGLACFVDAQTAATFSQIVNEYYTANPDGNYYDDILAAEFKQSVDPSYPYRDGDWNLHFPIKGDPENLAMFASGLGDGSYSSYWGLDGEGNPAMLVIDFEILGDGIS